LNNTYLPYNDTQTFKPVTTPKTTQVNYSPVTSNYSGNDAKKDVNEIAWLKQVYTNGSDSDKAWASTEAKKYYERLRTNGFSNLADSLEGLNAGDAYNFSKSYVPDYNGQQFADNYRTNASKAIDEQLKAMNTAYGVQKQGINQQYDDSAKKLYAGYLNSSKKLPQQLAAQGITGGASESANLKLSNNYMQNLYSQEMARNQALGEIDAAIAAATGNAQAQKYNLENQVANMAYDISRDTRDYYANERYKNATINQGQQQIDNSFYLSMLGNDFNERQFDFNKDITLENLNMTKSNTNWDRALAAAGLGNFDLLANELGITPQEAWNRYKQMVKFQDNPNLSSYTYTSSPGNNPPGLNLTLD